VLTKRVFLAEVEVWHQLSFVYTKANTETLI